MSRAALLLFALALLAGCPRARPATPGPWRFNAWALRSRLQQLLAARKSQGTAKRRLAEIHRDLGWLLLIHYGDARRAALHLRSAVQAAGPARAPWAWAGRALIADQALASKAAVDAWQHVLRQLAAGQPALRPPPGASLAALEHLAAARLKAALGRLGTPLPVATLEQLREQARTAAARITLSLLLLEHAQRRGDLDEIRRREGEAGYPPAVFVSRRYGFVGRTELGQVFAPESKGLPNTKKRIISGGLRLASQSGRPGVRYVGLRIQVPRESRAVLHVAFRGPFRVFLDGRETHRSGEGQTPAPLLQQIKLKLARGPHRLLLKVPVKATPQRLQLLITTEDGRPLSALQTAPGAPRRRSPPRTPPPAATESDRDLRAAYAPLCDLLAIQDALQVGLPDQARRAARRLEKNAPRFVWGLLARASLEQLDSLVPDSVGAARARALLARALRQDRATVLARLRLASLLRGQEKQARALRLLGAAPQSSPTAGRALDLARARLYRDLGWHALAAIRIKACLKQTPDWLTAWKLRYLLARSEGDAHAELRAARAIRRLDRTSLAWAQTLVRQGRHEEAVREARRLLTLRDDDAPRDLLATQLRLAGRLAAAERELRRALERRRWDSHQRIELANVLMTRGKRAAAVSLLRQGLAVHPEQGELATALMALGEPHPMDRHRFATEDLLRRYRKEKPWPGSTTPVAVLDRAAIRVFPGGGQMILTHQILHLRSKEAVRHYSEVKLPGGAQVLRLRTIKPDGSVRIPEQTGGKESISLPDVEVGDLVEMEYVEAQPARPEWRGGFRGSRFMFRSLRAHFYLSELVLLVPADLKLQLSAWGRVPRPRIRRPDGLVRASWTARRVDRLQYEPFPGSLLGPLPTVFVGSGVTWKRHLLQRRELSWGDDVASHAVRRLARRLCRPDASPEAKARRLHAWVQENIEQSGGLHASASHTLAQGSGSRINLLRSLLRLCRVGRVETRFIWPRHREVARGRMPLIGQYSQVALHLGLPGGRAIYLYPQHRQSPFGYLPPLLRGALSVALERPAAPPARTATKAATEARQVSLRVVLSADGSAVIHGEEQIHGQMAMQIRAALRRVPAQLLRERLERAYFVRHFTGATLKSLRFSAVKQKQVPLGVHYQLAVPALARRVGDQLTLRSGFFPVQLGRIYGNLARRRLPLRLGPVGPVVTTITIHAPPGLRLHRPPDPHDIKTPYGRFRLKARRAPQGVWIRRTLLVPLLHVPPEHYATFAGFASQVDQAEEVTVVFIGGK